MRTWSLLLFLPAVALAAGFKGVDHEYWTDKYDRHFRKYAKHYFGPAFDWRWFKAQGVAESGLRSDAVSKAGAIGIMQIMPSTYKEIHKKSPYLSRGTLKDPRWNIAAGIFYDRLLYRRWLKTLKQTSTEDGLYLTFASYNAGFGKITRILDRVKKQKPKVEGWRDIEQHAPAQTRHYVKRIRFLMGMDE